MKEDILKQAELKATKQRQTILEALSNAGGPVCAEELYQQLMEHDKMSLSTIYRNLAALTEKGVLIRMQRMDGRACYQLNTAAHRHQLVCAGCHEVVLLDSCPLEELGRQLSRETGYVITGHSLEFVGFCPRCAGKKGKAETP